MLLDAGADPNRPAFRGQRPLHVAASRGHGQIVDLLLARGADPALTDDGGRTARDWAEINGHASLGSRLDRPSEAPAVRRPARPRSDLWETGIRALDLLCPLPRRGLVRWEGGLGVGSIVLLIELCVRIAPAVDGVLWGGIEPATGDREDLLQDLREQDAQEKVEVLLAPRDASRESRRDLLRAVTDRARTHARRGGALLVLQSDQGFQSDIDALLPTLEAESEACLTTIVVAPPGAPDRAPVLRRPYASLAAFDPERARRGQWPALDLRRSTTRLDLPADQQRIVELLRAAVGAGSRAGRACAWYLAQPFYTTEPFSSLPGEWAPVAATIGELARIIEQTP
jgi:hypothetical protein